MGAMFEPTLLSFASRELCQSCGGEHPYQVRNKGWRQSMFSFGMECQEPQMQRRNSWLFLCSNVSADDETAIPLWTEAQRHLEEKRKEALEAQERRKEAEKETKERRKKKKL